MRLFEPERSLNLFSTTIMFKLNNNRCIYWLHANEFKLRFREKDVFNRVFFCFCWIPYWGHRARNVKSLFIILCEIRSALLQRVRVCDVKRTIEKKKWYHVRKKNLLSSVKYPGRSSWYYLRVVEKKCNCKKKKPIILCFNIYIYIFNRSRVRLCCWYRVIFCRFFFSLGVLHFRVWGTNENRLCLLSRRLYILYDVEDFGRS